MPVTKKTAPRGRRAKEDVQLEFARIEKESAEARELVDTKSAETSRLRESEVRQAVEGTSVESVVQQISALTLDVSKALGGLSEKLIAEVNLLASVREAVALERAELERLHKIDVAATSVDLLVQEHTRRKQEIESETESRRAAWTEETARVERERREQEEGLKKQRQRGSVRRKGSCSHRADRNGAGEEDAWRVAGPPDDAAYITELMASNSVLKLATMGSRLSIRS